MIPKIGPIRMKRLEQFKRDSSSEKYKNWKKAVLDRDKGKCQYPACSCTKDLEIHHIRRYANNPHLRYEVFNGITLCDKHHKGIYGREEFFELTFFKIVQANNAKNNSGHEGTESSNLEK